MYPAESRYNHHRSYDRRPEYDLSNGDYQPRKYYRNFDNPYRLKEMGYRSKDGRPIIVDGFNKPSKHKTLEEVPKDDDKVQWSYSKVGARFAERTTMHGIPYVFVSKKISAKIAWIIIFLVGVAVMIFHLFFLFETYLAFPKQTAVKLGFDNLDFPALTICNVNPILKSRLHLTSEYLKDLALSLDPDHIIDDYYSEEEVMQGEIAQKRKRSVDSFDEPLSRHRRYLDKVKVNVSKTREEAEQSYENSFDGDEWESIGEVDNAVKARREFYELYNQEDRENRIQIGHDFNVMLIKCSFAGRSCYSGNFTTTTHPIYGKCWTLDNKIFKSRKSGPDQGLELILFLQNQEYLEGLGNGYGARILVHDKDVMPDPYDEGYSVSPESATSIGIVLSRITRLGSPYGSCQKIEDFKKLYGVRYTRTSCQRFCEATAVMDVCKCLDSYKEEVNLKIAKVRKDKLKICSSEEELSCYFDLLRKFQKGYRRCQCDDPCEENKYEKSISLMQWPSKSYAKLLHAYLCDTHGVEACSNYDNSTDRPLAQNYLKLNVYYEDLNYQNITEAADYEFVQFISDVGGTLGLWIGLSVLSIIEIGQFLIELFQYMCCRPKK